MISITKRLSAFLCAAMLIALSTVTFFAYSNKYYALTDDAKIFSEAETANLIKSMSSMGESYDIQIIVHTSNDNIPSYDMSRYYNDEYYDEQSFESDSVMLVIDKASDHRVIITHGSTVKYFTDQNMDWVKSEMSPYLNSGDMYGATQQFLTITQEILGGDSYLDGSYNNYVDNSDYEEQQNNKLLYVLKHYGVIIGIAAVVIGGIVALIIFISYKRNGMSGTYDLHTNSTLNLTECEDIFLHERVTSRTISTSSSGGGSNSNSSGSSHGSSGSF